LSTENDSSTHLASSSSSETAVNGHDASKKKNESVVTTTSDADGSTPLPESPNLYDSELGRIAKTVD